ncbi:ISAzo13-like element transposase-related protein, partial [Caballeronia calidae]|uniref:ISAzo13-like element transposase-related protein n=1 Tax=Caballeronia calidae TaxID=1777139 RepID=UPI0018E0164F
MREHTAGSPQHEVIWTDLKPREIAEAMTQQVAARVSVRTVRQLLKQNGFSRRQSQKKK